MKDEHSRNKNEPRNTAQNAAQETCLIIILKIHCTDSVYSKHSHYHIMSGRCKGGKGLGKVGAKRHRKTPCGGAWRGLCPILCLLFRGETRILLPPYESRQQVPLALHASRVEELGK